MKTKVLSSFVAALVLAAFSAAAIPRPDIPTDAAARVPDFLTEYERGVLRREMAKLQKEIVAARRKAGEAEELAPLKAALAEAKLGGDATNVAAKASALSDATETVLYRDNPDIPDKLKRLQEVGRLLEYDTRREKQNRATHPPRPGIPAAGPDPAPADAGADAAAPSGEPAGAAPESGNVGSGPET